MCQQYKWKFTILFFVDLTKLFWKTWKLWQNSQVYFRKSKSLKDFVLWIKELVWCVHGWVYFESVCCIRVFWIRAFNIEISVVVFCVCIIVCCLHNHLHSLCIQMTHLLLPQMLKRYNILCAFYHVLYGQK